ncbi:MAG TPA: hypothetical protein VF902_04305 [Coriobacteriia bacterium]
MAKAEFERRAMTSRRISATVSRRTLTLVAGLVWSGVGIMLIALAATWLAAVPVSAELGLGGLGAVLAWQLLFRGLALRNLVRLSAVRERASLFAFQAPRSYLIMVSMIALGVVLRHSAVPKPDLAVAYAAIGGALFLSSLSYHARLLRPIERPCP